MTVNPFTSITTLPLEFVALLDTLLKDTTINSPEIVALNFRDPSHSAENGGYHPVEIHVDSKGNILCITDFSFVVIPPFVELGVELDWSFENEYFRQFDNMYDLECGRGLLGLYLANFTAYYKSGVYQVEITAL